MHAHIKLGATNLVWRKQKFKNNGENSEFINFSKVVKITFLPVVEQYQRDIKSLISGYIVEIIFRTMVESLFIRFIMKKIPVNLYDN